MKRFWLIGAGLCLALSTQAMAADKVDFATQVRPLFAKSCYKCHAGNKHKGDFKLDSVAAIRKGGKEAAGKCIVPGDPDKSDLYHRLILPKDDDDAMPPDGKGEKMTKPQVALIKAWILQGADFGTWTADQVKDTPDDKDGGKKHKG